MSTHMSEKKHLLDRARSVAVPVVGDYTKEYCSSPACKTWTLHKHGACVLCALSTSLAARAAWPLPVVTLKEIAPQIERITKERELWSKLAALRQSGEC